MSQLFGAQVPIRPPVPAEVKFVLSFFFLKKDFIYLFLERGKGREKEREKH